MSIWTPIRPAILDKTNPLARGLVGYWPMVAGTGGIVADISGYGNHGTITNATWTAGKFGHCLDFDGAGDYVDVANLPGTWLTPPMTAIAWFKCDVLPSTTGDEYTLFRYANATDDSDRWQIRLDDDNDKVEGTVASGGGFDSTSAITQGEWQMAVLVSDSSTSHQVYLDAIAGGTDSTSFPTITTDELRFGVNYYGGDRDYLKGKLDNVMIFDRALSAAEIQSLYRDPLQLLWIPRSKGWISYVDAGAVTVSPDALNFVAASTISDTILGSTTATPTASSCVLSSVAPGVVLGNLTISPTAVSGILSSVDPSVVFGSVTVSPAALSAVLASIDPTVIQGSTTATPTALSTILSSVDPTVDLGGIVVSPTALSAILSGTDPTTVLGDITVGPAALSAVLASIDPTAIGGGVTVAPTPSSAVLASVDPSTLYGSTTATPAASFLILSKTDPSVILGSISVTPDFVNMVMSKSDPTVSIEDIVAHTMALAMGANF